MNIAINGERIPLPADTLLDVLRHWGAQPPYAVALNGVFISRDRFAQQMVQPGDSIEVLTPIQGG